jgi:hypothetical protein
MQGFDYTKPVSLSGVASPEIRDNFNSIATCHSGSFPPPNPYIGYLWFNSDTNILRQYTSGGWIIIAGSNFGVMPWINVKDPQYGAVGDGLVDDTSAIIRAISSVPLAGGTVYFPAGVYLITPGNTGSGILINRSNIQLLGEPGSIIRGVYDVGMYNTHRMIQIYGTEGDPIWNIRIRDLEFDGSHRGTYITGSTQAHILEFYDANDIDVRDCYLQGSYGDGINVSWSSYTSLCRRVIIDGNRIDGARRNGISITAGNNIKVLHNTVQNFWCIGIDVEPDEATITMLDVIVDGNSVSPIANNPITPTLLRSSGMTGNSNRAYGISCFIGAASSNTRANVRIVNNYIEGVREDLLWDIPPWVPVDEHRYWWPLSGIFVNSTRDVIIEGNHVVKCGAGIDCGSSESADSSSGSIICNTVRLCGGTEGNGATGITGYANWNVVGNVVENNGSCGIRFNGEGNTCIGNICRNNGQCVTTLWPYGIWLEAGSNTVSNNKCYNNIGCSTQQYGIYLKSSVGDNIITANHLEGNFVKGIGFGAPALSSNMISRNIGFVTENWGHAWIVCDPISFPIIPPDTTLTKVIVHNLDIIPNPAYIHVTQDATKFPGDIGSISVGGADATTFTVYIQYVPVGEDFYFYWSVDSAAKYYGP